MYNLYFPSFLFLSDACDKDIPFAATNNKKKAKSKLGLKAPNFVAGEARQRYKYVGVELV